MYILICACGTDLSMQLVLLCVHFFQTIFFFKFEKFNVTINLSAVNELNLVTTLVTQKYHYYTQSVDFAVI